MVTTVRSPLALNSIYFLFYSVENYSRRLISASFPAGSMYDAANESVTLQLAELVSNSPTSQSLSVSSGGARLALPAAGVALSVAEGALSRGRREQIYVAVVKDDRYRPRLGKGNSQNNTHMYI